MSDTQKNKEGIVSGGTLSCVGARHDCTGTLKKELLRVFCSILLPVAAQWLIIGPTTGCKKTDPPPTIKGGDLVDPFPPDIKAGDLVNPYVVQSTSSPLLQVDEHEPNAYTCHCDCGGVVSRDLHVCVKNEDNPNLPEYGGTPPNIAADCAGRVASTLGGVAAACNYPSPCTCNAQASVPTFDTECNLACTENLLKADCSNFNPEAGIGFASATNAAGDEPVCSGVMPLTSDIFGRRSTCVVDGQAQVKIQDETQTTDTSGVVEFDGDPCPGATCAVGMLYELGLAPVTFGNFFQKQTFEDLSTLGRSVPLQDATLSPAGLGTFGFKKTATTAQGRRVDDSQAFLAFNEGNVDVSAKWGDGPPTCSVSGPLIGSADPELKRCENKGPTAGKICTSDADCTNVPECSDGICNCQAVADVQITAQFQIAGKIVNQPPFADAGPSQLLECEKAAATNVVLDGGGSSDADSNLAFFAWFRGSRAGTKIGSSLKTNTSQPLGTQTYVLRVIDAFAQSDEDTTVVRVADTAPPAVTCSVATPRLRIRNHRLVDVGFTSTATDICAGPLPVTATVYSDEDDVDTASAQFSPDAADIASGTLRLRAERNGKSDGRVYLIVPESTDPSGNRGFNCCTVIEPHSRNAVSIAAAEAQATAARAFCLKNNGTPPADYFKVGDGPVIGKKQ